VSGLRRNAASGRRAVFLDRDGVLIRDVDHLTAASQIEILPGVPEALRRLRDAGRTIVVVTNQSVVARGLVTEEELRRIHTVLEAQLRSRGASLDAMYYCPHHPEGAVARYRVVCDCRKPEPGLLLRAAADMGIDLAASVMVGDLASDVEAGRRAGCRTILIRAAGARAGGPGGANIANIMERTRAAAPDHLASNLQEAAEWIAALGAPS
jgi:D-glycero-D-manno-heptose 1,7-bisphosphate phosphatase